MNGGVRKRGKVWYYYFNIGSIKGKFKKVERIGGRTKAEAQDALRKALNEYETGFIEPIKTTLEDYLVDWLENQIKPTRKINTYDRYQSIVYKRVIPKIGHVKLKDLKPIHIESFINHERKTGISESSLQTIYGVINAALNRAMKLRIIIENPCKYVNRPKREKFVANTLTIEEFRAMIALLNLKKYNDYLFHLALNIVLELGIRRGELAGLEWSDINFEENTLTIKNNLIYTHGKTYMGTPKTEDSARTIYFSDNLRILLEAHKLVQEAHRIEYDTLYHVNEYDGKPYSLIMTWENGKHVHPLYYTQRISRLLVPLNITRTIRFHDLRHTNATLLLSEGIDFKTIQTRLGHTDIYTTLNLYSHVNVELQMNATNKISNLMNK
jgi:integrase